MLPLQSNLISATANKKKPTLAIVVPCFNEEESLRHTALELCKVIEWLNNEDLVSAASYMVFVDDGSQDNTWALIESFHAEKKSIKGLKLSRNFGHQAALLAGLDFVTNKCDFVVSIDADLQQDPFAIKKFIESYNLGCDVVLGIRNDRASDGWVKHKTATWFYGIMRMMGVNIVANHADYRLLSNKALNALYLFREPNVFLRAMCLQLGFKVGTVYFDVGERQYGGTKYTLRRMFRLAIDGVTSFSIVPLRMVATLGFVFFLGSLLMGGYVLWRALIVGDTMPGWASTTLPIYFIGGVQLLCLGIVGEYVGQIYKTVKNRPRWICDYSLG